MTVASCKRSNMVTCMNYGTNSIIGVKQIKVPIPIINNLPKNKTFDFIDSLNEDLGSSNVFMRNDGSIEQLIHFFNVPQKLYWNLSSASDRKKQLTSTRKRKCGMEWHLFPSNALNRFWIWFVLVLVVTNYTK